MRVGRPFIRSGRRQFARLSVVGMVTLFPVAVSIHSEIECVLPLETSSNERLAERNSITPFDLAEFRQRVPLSSYLDAGGELPPRAPSQVACLPVGSVRGRAFDATGRVLDVASIEIRRRVPGVVLDLTVARANTAFDGSFVCEGVPAGVALRLVVLRRTLSAQEIDVEVAAGLSLDLGNLITHAVVTDRRGECAVEFTLRDRAGRPLADLPLALSRRLDDDRGTPAFEREDSGRTDHRGRIRFAAGWLGGKRLDVLDPGLSDSFDFILDRAGTSAREFRVR